MQRKGKSRLQVRLKGTAHNRRISLGVRPTSSYLFNDLKLVRSAVKYGNKVTTGCLQRVHRQSLPPPTTKRHPAA